MVQRQQLVGSDVDALLHQTDIYKLDLATQKWTDTGTPVNTT